MTKPFNRILMTGAAGGLGRQLREHVKAFANIVRLSDLADIGPAGEGEEVVQCNLADREAVLKLCEGVDAILHFGGVSTEQQWEPIVQANFSGLVHLYEAVHKHGVKRVIFASSNHTMGAYETTDIVDASMPTRADGYYGLSKVFGESLAQYYWDRFGIETVSIRIGSCFPEPANPRMLITYLSLNDLVELLRCSLTAVRVGHTITFGVSNNKGKWWDDRHSRHLGYVPKDSSDQWIEKFAGEKHFVPSQNESEYPFTDKYQGGGFMLAGPKYPK